VRALGHRLRRLEGQVAAVTLHRARRTPAAEARERQTRQTILCPLCTERGETTRIPADWKHCGCLAHVFKPRSAVAAP
jgi:hypothetical protein